LTWIIAIEVIVGRRLEVDRDPEKDPFVNVPHKLELYLSEYEFYGVF